MMKISKKQKILTIILSIIAVILIIACIFVVKSINVQGPPPNYEDNDDDDNPDIVPYPTISVVNSIEIDKFETYTLTYEATNIENYNVTVSINNTNVATIDGDLKITPHEVGTTTIILSVNCSPAIQKTIDLTILDAVTDYSYEILHTDETIANNLYVNNEYLLEITENASVNTLPNIDFDTDYITDFTLLSKNQNVIKYIFTVSNYGSFAFDYISKYCHKETSTFTAYVYPEDYSINFTNVTIVNNVINLYLFNKDYASLANESSYYDNTSFDLITIENSNDEVEANINDDCVSLNNNTLTAVSEGTCKLTFKSNVSKITKEYTINVQKIKPASFVFNNKVYDINATIPLVLSLNTPYEFNFSIQPVFSYGNLDYICSSGLNLTNNAITLTSNDPQTLAITLDGIAIANFTITKAITYYIFADVYMSTSSYTFENDSLEIIYSENAELVLNLEIFDQTTNSRHSVQELSFDIADKTIIDSSDGSNTVKNYFAMLTVHQTGQTTIRVYNEDLNISKTITVIINSN